MELTVCAANGLSRLCVRVSRVERQLGIRSNFIRPNNDRQNPCDKINKLCQRIKRLEHRAGITTVRTVGHQSQLGPSGNALISNRLNQLCGRLARVQRRL